MPATKLAEAVASKIVSIGSTRSEDEIAATVYDIASNLPMAKLARELVSKLLSDRSLAIRRAGEQLALRFGRDPREVRKHVEVARDTERKSYERAAALWVLVLMKKRNAASTIVFECIHALESDDAELRDAAARCLAITRKGRAARALVDRLPREPDLLVTIAILDSLRYLHRTLWHPKYIVDAVWEKIVAMGEDGSLVEEVFFVNSK